LFFSNLNQGLAEAIFAFIVIHLQLQTGIGLTVVGVISIVKGSEELIDATLRMQ